MAGLRDRRDGGAAPDGSGAHLRKTLRPLHPGRHRRRGRSRRAGSQPEGRSAWKGGRPERSRRGASYNSASRRYGGPREGATATFQPALRVPTNEEPAVRASNVRKDPTPRPAKAGLSAQESATLRDQLIADLNRLQSSDEAADWVHKNLAVKNTLTAADADSVEASFRERLSTIESSIRGRPKDNCSSALEEDIEFSGRKAFRRPDRRRRRQPRSSCRGPAGTRRRRVAVKTIRLRDKEHCKYVTTQPCVVCGRTPSEAHHIRFAQPRALGRKVSDEYTVPVCRLHHRELHRYGDEASWWAGVNVDPIPIALELWRSSAPMVPAAQEQKAPGLRPR